MISDIFINKKPDWLYISKTIDMYLPPIIFIAHFADDSLCNQIATLAKTKFLDKPFHSLSLKSAINELLLQGGAIKSKPTSAIRTPHWIELIPVSDISWLDAYGDNSVIQTKRAKY